MCFVVQKPFLRVGHRAAAPNMIKTTGKRNISRKFDNLTSFPKAEMFAGVNLQHQQQHHLQQRLKHAKGPPSVEEEAPNRNQLTYSSESNSSETDVDFNIYDNKATKSSASSASWLDELELEATNKVRSEYEKTQKILYGERTSSTFNDELKQWMSQFCHLRVVGTNCENLLKPSQVYQGETESPKEEVFAAHSHDQAISSSELPYFKRELKRAVIAKILKDCDLRRKSARKATSADANSEPEFFDLMGSSGDSSTLSDKWSGDKTPVNRTLNPNTLSVEFETFLQISPIPLHESQRKTSGLEARSLVGSKTNLRAGKEETKYHSLPKISRSSTTVRVKPERIVKAIDTRKNLAFKDRSLLPSPPKRRDIFLPPIETSNLQSDRQSASISKKKYSLSPVASQLDELIRQGNSRFELANFIVNNHERL